MRFLLSFFVAAALFATAPRAEAKDPEVVFETTHGTIVIRLFEKKAPGSVKNILQYVDDGFYSGVVFHRVIKGFMLQVGGYDGTFTKKPVRPTIQNEADNGLKNKKGTLSLARTGDPHSATSQFFINTVDNKFLDHRSKDPRGWGYCVFGEVISGMDVVMKIESVKTLCPSKPKRTTRCTDVMPPGMAADVPAQAIVIKKAYRKK